MLAHLFLLLFTIDHVVPDTPLQDVFDSLSFLFLYGNRSSRIPDTTVFRTEYDFIVIGAGSGGSVMANRLSENPNWNVLLLEVGKEENLVVNVPLTAGLTTATSEFWWGIFGG